MTLSNTATPYYYGQFREKVLSGKLPVNQYVAMEMTRIDSLIADPRYYYDPDAVEGWIAFVENELTLTDGSPQNLLDTFALWGEELLGWYYFVDRNVYDSKLRRYVKKRIKKRLINEQYIIAGRGVAKTMYDFDIQAYYLTVDMDTTKQIAVAPTMKQAEEVLAPFRTSINKHSGPLFKFLCYGSIRNTSGSPALRPKLMSTKQGIVNNVTGSELSVYPLSIDKLQGQRIKVATLDEWLSGETRENPIVAIRQSARKGGVEDYVIIATSSEGNVRNGVGDEIKMELISILRGEYSNPHVSIWYYRLDDETEVGDARMWIKANPNLDKTVTYETYQDEVDRMEANPSTKNEILAKRFGIPKEGFTYYFTYEETETHPYHSYSDLPCSMGLDLSQGDDFCSFTFLFPNVKRVAFFDRPKSDNPRDLNFGSTAYGVKTRNYISSATYYELPRDMKELYDTFIKEGSLCVLEGPTLDVNEVYEDLDAFIADHRYDVRSVGYDPYNSEVFLNRWIADNGPYAIEKVRQGVRTESVPLGELKVLARHRMLLFDEELMKFTMGNCMAKEDTNGNRMLWKKRRDKKIDAVAALLDAYVAYNSHKEDFL